MGVLDGLLKTGAATADSQHLPHNLFQALDHTYTTVELDYVNGLKTITECAIDYAIEIAKALTGDGAANVDGYQKLGVESSDRAHIFESGTAVRAHPGKLTLGGEDAGPEATEDIAPVDFGLSGRFKLLDKGAGQRTPGGATLDNPIDKGYGQVIFVPELR